MSEARIEVDVCSASALEELVGEPAARFTRHAAGMLLLDRIAEISPEFVTCTWTVPDAHPLFSVGGQIPAYVAIECMAQCVAVHAGAVLSLDGKGPPLGLLLGTRHFKAAESFLNKGNKLRISCRELVKDAQGLASFECRIQNENTTVASCRLAVYQFQEENREE